MKTQATVSELKRDSCLSRKLRRVMRRKSFIALTFNSLAIAVAIVFAAITTAKGENYSPKIESLSIPDNVVNGLFTPNQSQQFFQRGREAFEREVEIYNYPERYNSDNLLEIAPESVERIKKLQPSAVMVDGFNGDWGNRGAGED